MTNLFNNFPQWSLLLFLLYLMIFGNSQRPLAAQTPKNEPPREPPLDLKLLEQGIQPDSDDVITAVNIAERARRGTCSD